MQKFSLEFIIFRAFSTGGWGGACVGGGGCGGAAAAT
jgi:hypothetical protein